MVLSGWRRHRRERGPRAFLKIQEGCRQFCSYCIVPLARGPLYSRPVEETVRIAGELAAEGFRELVLTGVHLGYYGHDTGREATISSLLRELVKIEGLQRIRLSSLEPTEITTELVDLILEEEKICRHLHLPLQSGDDFILKQMNRRYSAAEFLHLVMWLRSRIPDIALTTDVMVGFPQETEIHFNNTVRVVREAAFSRLHVFKYSPRRGTPAAAFPGQVPAKEKEKRSRRLIAVGRELAADYHRKFIGKKVDVLFEEAAGDKITGFTEHYVRVSAPSAPELLGKSHRLLSLPSPRKASKEQ